MPSTIPATVFYEDAGEASAKVFAVAAPTLEGRALTIEELAAAKLDCRVEGPTCRYSTTLKTTTVLKHRGITTWGDASAAMAEAFLPDPCPWSTELPFLYRVVGQVRLGDRVVGEIDQNFGIRPIGVVRRRIVLNGKTWVPRAVNRSVVTPATELGEWRESAVVMSVIEPDDALCQEASEIGVPLITGVRNVAGGEAIATLRRLGRFPAVVGALVQSVTPLAPALRSAARNTLLSCFQPSVPPAESSDATDVFVSTAYDLALPESVWNSQRPVLAFAPLQNPHSLAEARARCDDLQRQLAGKCEPAGYLV